MHSERFVIDDRRMRGDDLAPRRIDSARKLKPTTESVGDQEGGGALSDGMRSYILAYGGPITAECTNPLIAPS